MKTNEQNWRSNGTAFFLNFSAGRSVTGTVMVGQFAGGQWVSGSRLLGDRPCGRGYYKLKEEAPLFENRELAEEYARKLAIESVQANFETELYLADLDKKSPWKNTPTPILNPVTFEIK